MAIGQPLDTGSWQRVGPCCVPYPASLLADHGLGAAWMLPRSPMHFTLIAQRHNGSQKITPAKITPREWRDRSYNLPAHRVISLVDRNRAAFVLTDFFQVHGCGHFVGEFVEPLE